MTDWLSASAMLLSGLIVGFMFLYGMKRRDEESDMERKDLEAKRDALIAQLRTETDPQERTRLELEAADVLRRLDGVAASGAADGGLRARRPSSRPNSSALVGFLWGAGSVAALVGIGYYVTQNAKPKEEAQAPMSAPAAQTDTAVRALETAVQKNPNDLTARDDLAKAYLDRENVKGVVEQTQYVLQRSPEDARALTYEALVRIATGQPEPAVAMLQRATKSDPDLLDAWVGLAWVNAQAGKMPAAQKAIDEAKRRHPDQAQRLDEVLTHMQPATPIHITLNAARAADKGLLFVIARAEGVTSGPPIAVKRLPLGAFPMQVDISSADSMTGAQLPARVRIEARIDDDGDPLTKSPNDMTAFQDGVSVGQSVTLTLK